MGVDTSLEHLVRQTRQLIAERCKLEAKKFYTIGQSLEIKINCKKFKIYDFTKVAKMLKTAIQ
jgi:hypothetical protein